MSAILPPEERLWWKHPLDRVEGTWIFIALIWCLIMFAMMVGWHIYGKQNLSTETYKTTPEKFTASAQAFVDKYTVRTETADKTPVVVNLASQEYFKAVDRKVLQARVVECVFEEYRSGQYKVISFMAKRARGLMARYAAQHRLVTPGQLESFDLEGYALDTAVSLTDRLVFRRRQVS